MEYDIIRILEETKKHDMGYILYRDNHNPDRICVGVFLNDNLTEKTYLIERYYGVIGFDREVIMKL